MTDQLWIEYIDSETGVATIRIGSTVPGVDFFGSDASAGASVYVTGTNAVAGTTIFAVGTDDGEVPFRVDGSGNVFAVAPTADLHVATKKYVDDNAGGGGSGAGATTFQVNDGNDAIATTLGDAPSGIFVTGKGGIRTSAEGAASGNTVYIFPAGTTIFGNDGSSVSGASNLWIVNDDSGTSVTVVSDGKGGATAYVGGYSSGDSIYAVGASFANEATFIEPSTEGGYSSGTAFNLAGLRKSELNIGENVMQTLYDTDHEAQTNAVMASVSGYSKKGGVLKVLNVNLGQNRYNAAWQNTSVGEGTDKAPSVNYIYLEESGSTIQLTDSTSSPEGKRYIHVGEMILGDVAASGATIYVAHSQNAYLKKFAHEVMDRFHEQGAFYLSGFNITSTSSGVSIEDGEYMDVVKTISCSGASTNPLNSSMQNMGSSAAGMFWIKNNGDYSATTGFRFHDEYADGVAIGSNKYYNINIGIVQSGLTTSGATPFRIFAMVQKGSAGEYGTFNAAFADEYGQEVSTPSVGMIKHVYIPIARMIAKAGVLFAFPDGNYHQDIRNRAAGGGAGQTVKPSVWTDDGTMLAPSTATRAVQVNSGITAGILSSGTSTYLAGTLNIVGDSSSSGYVQEMYAAGVTTPHLSATSIYAATANIAVLNATGVTTPHLSATSTYTATLNMGDGQIKADHHVANYQIASLALGWTYAGSGSSGSVVSPFAFTYTGVSFFSKSGNFTGGVSVWTSGAAGSWPNTALGDHVLTNASGSGTCVYNESTGTTTVNAGEWLFGEIIGAGTAGISNYTVQIFGTKD